MNVLSLFDGISAGQLALQRANINVEKYYASEIDKHAISVTMKNFPNTIQLGDIKNIDGKLFSDIDMIIGGSPCQNFSFIGKRKGMVTKDNIEITSLEQYLVLKDNDFEFEGQSYLFWEYVRLLKEIKPRYFLLENVKMLSKWKNIISNILEVEPIEINSSLVCGANRKRLYWTNIKNVIQPIDNNIKLKDILQLDVIGNLTDDYINHKLSQKRYGNHFGTINTEKHPCCYILEKVMFYY